MQVTQIFLKAMQMCACCARWPEWDAPFFSSHIVLPTDSKYRPLSHNGERMWMPDDQSCLQSQIWLEK